LHRGLDFRGVNGAERNRTPVASKTAFDRAAEITAPVGSPAPQWPFSRAIDQFDLHFGHIGKDQDRVVTSAGW